jgi:hypothetical protein
MQFKLAALDQIAKFIVGDNPLPFPYRSSSKLTSFFTRLGLDYYHRSESRNKWTLEAVIEINKKSSEDGPFPSHEMVSVIEDVLNPTYFNSVESDFLANVQSEKVNYDAALELMNQVLRPYQLQMVPDRIGGTAKLKSIDGQFVSTARSSLETVQKLTFAPKVFDLPQPMLIQHDLVAIMMPFDAAFVRVQEAIEQACGNAIFRCRRADDIWANSSIIQDVFELIVVSEIVVVDLTGKNPNVMYETGIAHTLGKHVVPIAQSIEHVPFDLRSHRVLPYHPNREGLSSLVDELTKRLLTIKNGHSWED